MAASMQFWIGNSSTLAQIGMLTKINSASVNLLLNGGGNVSLLVDRSDPVIFSNANPISNCILIYRGSVLVWSGPIWNVSESYGDASQRKVTINAVGWFELLNHRLIRSLPGYVLTTSPITWSNGNYESAVSGIVAANSTVARDTVNFHAGAGSLGWTESITGPFGTSQGPAPYIATTNAAPLSGTPTAGKRYKLNLWALGRKSPASVGATPPWMLIFEGPTPVGRITFDTVYGNLVYNTNYTAGIFSAPTTIPGAGASTGVWTQYSAEWVSTGVAPTFTLNYLVNPTQLTSSILNWYIPGGATQRLVGSQVVFTTYSTGATLEANIGNWNGTFVNGRSYTVSMRYQLNSPCSAGNLNVFDSAGTLLGSSSMVGSNVTSPTTTSVTFTAGTNQFFIDFQATFAGASGDVMAVQDVSMKETNTDTDALLNLDDITLQEYAGDGIYSNMDAGAIATALLQKTNSDGATKIIPGSVQATQPRTRTYQQFSNVGKEILALSNIESGYDFWIDPATRALNIYNRTNATNFPVSSAQASGPTYIYSADRTKFLNFAYGYGQDNLKSITKTQDGSTLVNRLNVQGKYALGQASDVTSQSTYGIFEDLVSLPDVIDASTSVLPFYANAEIQFRKNPKIVYNIELKTGDQENAPKIFIDFNIGDRATLQAGAAVLMSGQLNQTVRIFGCQVSVDSEGNEVLSGIQMSA